MVNALKVMYCVATVITLAYAALAAVLAVVALIRKRYEAWEILGGYTLGSAIVLTILMTVTGQLIRGGQVPASAFATIALPCAGAGTALYVLAKRTNNQILRATYNGLAGGFAVVLPFVMGLESQSLGL